MNANTEYEIKAMAYRIMTGHNAPGKDWPAGVNEHRDREEQEAWAGWIEDYGNCIRAVLMALDALSLTDEHSPKSGPGAAGAQMQGRSRDTASQQTHTPNR